MNLRISIDDVRAAENIIAGRVLRTPTVMSPGMTNLLRVPVALKLETLQRTGSFKPRGITYKVRCLSAAERARGVVTVSGGNHGIAMASIARSMGLAATIVMPDSASARSRERIQTDGATLLIAPDVEAAYEMAEKEREKGLTYIHAYDDPLIIAGHGTLGLELIADAPEVTDVLVSIGGGALISGVATAIKAMKPSVRIWGVETEGADAMSTALAAGGPIAVRVTSLATTLGAPVVSERTLAHVKDLVEDVFVVSDAEAVQGALALAEEAKVWVEPAAGCLVPAARQVVAREGRDIVLCLVLCGGNVSFRDMARWVDKYSS